MPGGRALALRLASLAVAVVVALALAACGRAEPADDNYGYGWSYDEIAASGLRLRYDAAVPSGDRAPLAIFEQALAETETCAGLAAAGPLVVVMPRGSLDGGGVTPPPGAHVGGLYYFDTDLVVVSDSLYALRHEFVHYLLDQAGFHVARNRAHDHPAFDACGGPTLR